MRISGNGQEGSWTQPIVYRSEIGILGVVVGEFDGDPARPDAGQDGAGRSRHGAAVTHRAGHPRHLRGEHGAAVRRLEHFGPPDRVGRGLFDSPQWVGA